MSHARKRFVAAALVLVVLIAVTALCLRQSAQKKAAHADKPLIATTEELRRALTREPNEYIVLNLPLTGEPTSDPLGIVLGDYLQIEYRFEVLTEATTDDSEGYSQTTLEWCDEPANNLESQTSTVMLAETTALDVSAVRYEQPYFTPLDTDNCVRAARYRLDDGYFYPHGVSLDEVGTERYRFSGVPVGAKATFAATIGSGSAAVDEIAEGLRVVAIDGELKDLLYYASETETGVMTVALLLLLPPDLFLWGWAVVALFKSRTDRRKNA